MAKRCWVFAAFLLLSAVLMGCAQTGAPEPIRVGQLVGPEGELPTAGQHARQGVQLLTKQWQAENQRVAGRPLTVLHVAARGEGESMHAEAVRLLAVNRVAALLAGFDPAGNEQQLRAARAYNVPVIVPGEMAEAPAQEGVVVLGPRPQRRGQLLAEQARQLKARRAAVVRAPDSPVATALASAFAQSWRDKEGHGVEEWLCGREADLGDLTTRIAGTKPDVVLLAMPAVRFRTLRARLVAAGVKAPLLYGGEDASWSLLEAQLEAGPEVILATVYPPTPTTDLGKDFARRYQDAYHEPPDLFAAQSYDAARLLFQAMSQAQSSQGPVLASQLQKMDSFETVTGKVSWKDRRPQRVLFLVRLDGAKSELIRTCPAEGP